MSGEVAKVKMDTLPVIQIVMNHPNGMQTRYSSVADILVKAGDKVTQGEQIANRRKMSGIQLSDPFTL